MTGCCWRRPGPQKATLCSFGLTLSRDPRFSAASSGAREIFKKYVLMSWLYGENQPISPLCVHLSKEYVDDIMNI